jgi:glutamate 5-kinase
MGVGKLNLTAKPTDLAGKQACAAVGQCELMYSYDRLFQEYNHTVAQLLLTAPDLNTPDRLSKFENTIKRLLELKALPIINENDTVSTAEIEFGDNDTLAAEVAKAAKADLLVLLSDIDGLYTADPRSSSDARLIPEVFEISEEIVALAGGAGTKLGTGGMETKIKAAKIATAGGCDMVITNGAYPERLYNIIDGNAIGTRFFSKKNS